MWYICSYLYVFLKTFFRSQSYSVQLPGDFVCEDCTIRLLREALEWGNSYRFWSCADVDIKTSNYLIITS